jgi:pimeloyl-ACP methyl ester carboxylesterase
MSIEPRSGHYESQRLRLHYNEWGDRSAPPLILQHGGRDHARSWDRVVEALLPDWWIITPDLRGHGDSEWAHDGGYGMEDFLFDHAMLFDALNIEKATVVGHSLGGNIVLRHAAARPDRVARMVVIEGLGLSPAAQLKADAEPIDERLAKWIAARSRALTRKRRIYTSIEEATARLQGVHPHFAPDLARHLAVHGVEAVEGGYCFKADPALAVHRPHDISPAERHEMWRAVQCETLLVYGKDSFASNPLLDGRTAYFRHARLELVDDAGHWLHHDRPAEFIALLRRFL